MCLLLAVVCMGMGCVAWQRTASARNVVRLVCADDELSRQRAEQIRAAERQKEDGIAFVAWREQRDCVVRDAAGSRAIYVDVLTMYGSSELLFPVGPILHVEDTDGCLLGAALAEQIFGNRDALGCIVDCGGRELVVRGVLCEPGMLLVVQEEEQNATFDRITLEREPMRTRSRTAQRFAAAYGLDVDWICYELFGAEYLQERIPGKWSDFAGWRQSLLKMKEDFECTISVEKSREELLYLQDVGEAFVCCGVGFFSFAAGVCAKRNRAVGK